MLRQFIHTAPAGFERFFAIMAAEFQREGGPDMAEIDWLSAEFGIHCADLP